MKFVQTAVLLIFALSILWLLISSITFAVETWSIPVSQGAKFAALWKPILSVFISLLLISLTNEKK